jgi:tRNA A37 N6-isopentenylltransferase MiaA
MAVAAKQPQSTQVFEVFNMTSTPVCRQMPALVFGGSTAGGKSQIALRLRAAPPLVVDGPCCNRAHCG